MPEQRRLRNQSRGMRKGRSAKNSQRGSYKAYHICRLFSSRWDNRSPAKTLNPSRASDLINVFAPLFPVWGIFEALQKVNTELNETE